MKLGQARVLIAGPEKESRILAKSIHGSLGAGIVDVASSSREAFHAIDTHAQTLGVDIIVTAPRLPDDTTAQELVNHADEKAPRTVPSVLLYSSVHDELDAGKRAIPGAEILLNPFELRDFKKKLHDLANRRG
mgnify:CR=1 FL=1